MQRSVSPSKFESHATGSPTKLSVPNRKIRNQPSNRVHDIEFAAEISTSLIAQVRNLQSLLSEREEEVKTLQGDNSRLEIDSENFQQRLKTLDESEHRYKEENWNLETRLQEMTSQQKEASDREKKLAQALSLSNTEKAAFQKELDESKLSHSKLSEEHAAALKLLETELGNAKRNNTVVEDERAVLQRKVDDLMNQNQELARAFSTQRGRMFEQDPASGLSDEEFETATDNVTPEHSPPPSPIKGTPRHAVLETETMKTSLLHAQRTIQSQKNQIHREKTEKLELRRIVQDLRDDLERLRNDATGVPSNRRSRKVDSKEFKKPTSKLLGTMRSSRQEILTDDPEWEDNQDATPSGSPTVARKDRALPSIEASDSFETANEASESAFETANERVTETDDFQTGQEDVSDSDGAATETESAVRGFGSMRRPNLPAGLARAGNRESFHSTASTSADEDLTIMPEVRTPPSTMSSLKNRFRLPKNPFSRSRQASEEPNMQSSPASFISSTGTPRAGQSLFAELQDFGGSEDESMGGTPAQQNTRHATPASARRTLSPAAAMPVLARAIMIDSSTMTEPVVITPEGSEQTPTQEGFLQVEHDKRPASMESVVNTGRAVPSWRSSVLDQTDESRPISTVSYSDAGAQFELDQFPAPPTSPPRAPELTISSIQTQHVEPRQEIVAPPTPPALSLSSIVAQGLYPVAEPEPVKPAMTMAKIQSQMVEPIEAPPTPKVVPVVPLPPPSPELTLSSIMGEAIEPVSTPATPLAYSRLSTQHVEPVSEPETLPPSLTMSSISTEFVEPRSSISDSAAFAFSPISSIETRPESPRNERRDGFYLPRDGDPETPNRNLFGALFSRGNKAKDYSPVIAEDETRQSPSSSPSPETPESQRPFREISNNSNARPTRKPTVQTSDQGAQTTLTSGAIDKLVTVGERTARGHQKSSSIPTVDSPETTGTVRIHRSQENMSSPIFSDDSMMDTSSLRRPGSAASSRFAAQDVPPLPSNHRQAIEAARSGSSHGAHGSMGPPLWPASAMKHRPRTPSHTRTTSHSSERGTPTPRAARTGLGFADVQTHQQKKLSTQSRRSSVSSFASEIDTRFNMRPGDLGMDPTGFGPNTDPRMIQAITQTMIGEYLWKYTRKTGRGELSENRHRRYFWVHPYTRTLYWSDRDPSSAGKSELKAKSVPIEAVRVMTDDNPMPPGLHRKSLVVISPGRTIKFTCATGQRHETWFNALSYLLLRTNRDAAQSDALDVTDNITREDVDEFNPQYGRRAANGNRLTAPSMSSYNSRNTRHESPAETYSMTIPTLTPTPHRNAAAQRPSHRPSMGTLSKLSGYWKMSSLRSRTSTQPEQTTGLYGTDEAHDSAEDLRAMIEQQDREADRLENVRACCDGKHDVGNISHSKRGRHSHASQSTTSTPMASTRTRA